MLGLLNKNAPIKVLSFQSPLPFWQPSHHLRHNFHSGLRSVALRPYLSIGLPLSATIKYTIRFAIFQEWGIEIACKCVLFLAL